MDQPTRTRGRRDSEFDRLVESVVADEGVRYEEIARRNRGRRPDGGRRQEPHGYTWAQSICEHEEELPLAVATLHRMGKGQGSECASGRSCAGGGVPGGEDGALRSQAGDASDRCGCDKLRPQGERTCRPARHRGGQNHAQERCAQGGRRTEAGRGDHRAGASGYSRYRLQAASSGAAAEPRAQTPPSAGAGWT